MACGLASGLINITIVAISVKQFALLVLPCSQISGQNSRMNIGLVIKALRSEKELSQEALALEVDTATSNLSRIEKGTRTPSLDLLYRIAKALDVKVSQLFGMSEGADMPIYHSKIDKDVQEWDDNSSDFADDAIQLRRVFRELTPYNRRIALGLLKTLVASQDTQK